MNCPHCLHNITGTPEFCESCGRILPVLVDRSPYQVLGYDRERLNIDLEDLEQRFFERSKKFHPDRFVGKSPQEIQFSLDHSSALNNAYRTLKSPVNRAKYAVERELGSIEEKSASVPPELADLFFEVHDHLDLIRESPESPPQEALNSVNTAEMELREQVRQLEAKLEEQFLEYDEQPQKHSMEKLKEILSHRSYIESFLRQIDNTLGRE